MDFEELRHIHRQEKNSSQLASISDDFFLELKAFIAEKRKKYLNSLKNGSLDSAQDISNIERMAREILQIREKKVVRKALHASFSGEYSLENLCSQEKKLFENLLKAFNSYKKEMEKLFALPESQSTKQKDLNMLPVQIIQDVPAFVGTDMKEYGPFKKGQLVKLPAKTAELLIARKLAVEQ